MLYGDGEFPDDPCFIHHLEFPGFAYHFHIGCLL